jgi:hypothetical protein
MAHSKYNKKAQFMEIARHTSQRCWQPAKLLNGQACYFSESMQEVTMRMNGGTR